MKRSLLHTFVCILFSLCCSPAAAQRSPQFEAYIEQFAPIAVSEMQVHGIPASITLAQGLLESGAGTSWLARLGNNHFGIKAASDWQGPFMTKDDDAQNEHFRVYTDAAQSYSDHSLFLRNRSRYASLFSLPITDYKAWAHGLKAAGYATSPTYAQRLIQLIETYDLARFDRVSKVTHQATAPTSATQVTSQPITRPVQVTSNSASNSASFSVPSPNRVFRENGAYYVIAQVGDTYKTIAQRWNVREGSLRRYNEQRKGYEPRAGERVYLVQKKSRADKRFKNRVHVVQQGETLHAIAQYYAIRTRSLYKLNSLSESYVPSVGDRLRLR